MSEYQSAYGKFHSSETALLHVQNDILVSLDFGHSIALLLLDLSAAFDTIDHNILLHRLKQWFGITFALSSLSSFLTNHFQTVVTCNSKSQPVLLEFGIPQGNVLEPLSTFCTPPHSILTSQNTLASVFISMRLIHKYIFHFPQNMCHPPYLLLSLASKMFSLDW